MKSKTLLITKELIPEGIKLMIKGRINSDSADEFQDELKQAMDNGYKNIIVNMIWVDFLSSAGIRVILKTYKELSAAGGRFGIEKPSQTVKNILGMTALDEMLIK